MSRPNIRLDSHAELEPRVLELVGQLVTELRPGSSSAGIGLGDSLERDLGLGSLERVELVTRLEQAIGVRLNENAIATADTPADLIQAITATKPAEAESVPSVLPSEGPGIPAPETAKTLVDVIQWHAEKAPLRPHICLRQEDGTDQKVGSRFSEVEGCSDQEEVR